MFFSKNKIYYAIILLPIFSLCLANFFIFNADDLGVRYSEDAKNSFISGNYTNYRYFILALSYAIRWLKINYFDNVIINSLLYSAGLIYFCYEFSRYVGISLKYIAFFCIAVAFQGFMADLSSFTMAYWNYGISWIAMGGALYFLRTSKNFWGLSAAIILSVITLTSYQVAAQLLILAAGCAYLYATLFKPKDSLFLELTWRPVFVYVVSCAIFLVMKKCIGPEWGRPVHFSALIHNIKPYFTDIFYQFFNGKYSSIFPMHERFLYFSSILVISLYLICMLISKRNYCYFFALLSLAACLAFAENPFNLPFDLFWPSPRSLTCNSFLYPVLLIFVVQKIFSYHEQLQKPAFYLGAVFLLLSVNNQAGLFMERREQTQRDIEIGNAVLSDIKNVAGIYNGEKISVVSSWRNIAQLNTIAVMDYASSAFTTGWSPVPLLRKLSGADLRSVSMPASVCPREPERWDVLKINDVVVVCMK
ncbi:hypothetical protein [Acetobacter persici]|uniref:hypothetical protein n=1 Tax=Acetobacter persici TaxID=1076596 RepID=UPI0039EA3EE2